MAVIEGFLTVIPEQLAKGNLVDLGKVGSLTSRHRGQSVKIPSHI